MKYYLFLDESGGNKVEVTEPNYPVFILGGLLIEEKEYEKIKEEVMAIKFKFFGNTSVVLHAMDIKYNKNGFFELLNEKTKDAFSKHLSNVFKNFNYKIFFNMENKTNFKELYSNISDLYPFSFSSVVEQVAEYLLKNDNKGSALIIAEIYGRLRLQKRLLYHFDRISNRSGLYSKMIDIKKRFTGLVFSKKSDNEIGIQLSDMVIYDIAKHFMNKNDGLGFYKTFKNKIER